MGEGVGDGEGLGLGDGLGEGLGEGDGLGLGVGFGEGDDDEDGLGEGVTFAEAEGLAEGLADGFADGAGTADGDGRLIPLGLILILALLIPLDVILLMVGDGEGVALLTDTGLEGAPGDGETGVLGTTRALNDGEIAVEAVILERSAGDSTLAIDGGRFIATVGLPVTFLLSAGINSHAVSFGGDFLAILINLAGSTPKALAHLSAISGPL